jgi:hypothetical protein
MHLSPETRVACAIGELKTLIQVSRSVHTRITCYRLREHNPFALYAGARDHCGLTAACINLCVCLCGACRRSTPRSWRTRAILLALATAT